MDVVPNLYNIIHSQLMETKTTELHYLQPGTSLNGGKYIIERKIGEGGFSITYRARQTALNRPVCIKEYFLSGRCVRSTQDKTVRPQGMSADAFEKYRTAFVNEAQTVAKLQHQSIVRVIDIFDENNTSYMVMPFIEGSTLEDIVKRDGPLSYQDAVNYIAQVADAVGYIHNKHILHRDIKPENIMITSDYKAILIDFGSAREFEEDKTQAYTSLVTYGYAPPEQYTRNSHKGAYSDIYALGATLYFIITGRVPVEAAARVTESMPTPKELNRNLPVEADRTIMKAMQMKSQDRHQSIAEFMDDLRNIKPSKPVKKKMPKAIAILMVSVFVLALFGSGVWWFFVHDKPVVDEPQQITTEEMFGMAKVMMDSTDSVTFMHGYQMMDSLSELGYIPAMYEMVRTLSWNSNDTSIRRKDMCGVVYDEDNAPVDSSVNRVVVQLSDRILNTNDSAWADVKMKVAFLMYFYYKDDRFNIQNGEKSLQYLDEAQYWAEYYGDSCFLNKIVETKKSN